MIICSVESLLKVLLQYGGENLVVLVLITSNLCSCFW